MIEKLDLDKRNSFGTLDWLEHWNEPSGAKLIESKINELVDAVNGILYWHENLPRFWQNLSQKENAENKTPTDPYAEQRKWIGCVCRFWFDNPDDTVLDYLGKIQTGENGIEYYGKETYDWFPHCKPVKPDDDIIYKGEQK